jgi:hypothetical protein
MHACLTTKGKVLFDDDLYFRMDEVEITVVDGDGVNISFLGGGETHYMRLVGLDAIELLTKQSVGKVLASRQKGFLETTLTGHTTRCLVVTVGFQPATAKPRRRARRLGYLLAWDSDEACSPPVNVNVRMVRRGFAFASPSCRVRVPDKASLAMRHRLGLDGRFADDMEQWEIWAINDKNSGWNQSAPAGDNREEGPFSDEELLSLRLPWHDRAADIADEDGQDDEDEDEDEDGLDDEEEVRNKHFERAFKLRDGYWKRAGEAGLDGQN